MKTQNTIRKKDFFFKTKEDIYKKRENQVTINVTNMEIAENVVNIEYDPTLGISSTSPSWNLNLNTKVCNRYETSESLIKLYKKISDSSTNFFQKYEIDYNLYPSASRLDGIPDFVDDYFKSYKRQIIQLQKFNDELSKTVFDLSLAHKHGVLPDTIRVAQIVDINKIIDESLAKYEALYEKIYSEADAIFGKLDTIVHWPEKFSKAFLSIAKQIGLASIEACTHFDLPPERSSIPLRVRKAYPDIQNILRSHMHEDPDIEKLIFIIEKKRRFKYTTNFEMMAIGKIPRRWSTGASGMKEHSDMLLELDHIEQFIEQAKKSNTFLSLSKYGLNAQVSQIYRNQYLRGKNDVDNINVNLNYGLTQYNYDPNIYVASENKITSPLIAWQVCYENFSYNSSNVLISDEQVMIAKTSNIEKNQKILSLGFHSDKLGSLGVNDKTPYVYFGINNLTEKQINNINPVSFGLNYMKNSSVILNHKGIAAESWNFHLDARPALSLYPHFCQADNDCYDTLNKISFFGISSYETADLYLPRGKKVCDEESDDMADISLPTFDTGLKIATPFSNPSILVGIRGSYPIKVARNISLQNSKIVLNEDCFTTLRGSRILGPHFQYKTRLNPRMDYYYRWLINSKTPMGLDHETV